MQAGGDKDAEPPRLMMGPRPVGAMEPGMGSVPPPQQAAGSPAASRTLGSLLESPSGSGLVSVLAEMAGEDVLSAGRSSASLVITESDGMSLHLSAKSSTGYAGVSDKTGRKRSKPFEVKGPKDRYLGAFDSAVEGAVCYAKFMQSGASDVAQALMGLDAEPSLPPTDEDTGPADSSNGQLVAEAEGMALHLSSKSSTGYAGVYHKKGSRTKPYRVFSPREENRKRQLLGYFSTAVEAAVCYARFVQQEALDAENGYATATSPEGQSDNEQPGEVPSVQPKLSTASLSPPLASSFGLSAIPNLPVPLSLVTVSDSVSQAPAAAALLTAPPRAPPPPVQPLPTALEDSWLKEERQAEQPGADPAEYMAVVAAVHIENGAGQGQGERSLPMIRL